MPTVDGYFKKGDAYEAWIEYQDGEVKFRSISMPELLKIQSKATRKVHGGIGGKNEVVDRVKSNRLLAEKVVIDWKGFQLKDGTIMECTKENVAVMMVESVDFAFFVNDVATNLQKYEQEGHEESEKNSESTSERA